MSRTRTLSTLCVVSLLAGLASTHAAAAPAQGAPASADARAPVPTRKPVANARGMNKAAFEALSDDDVVEVSGKTMTKREVAAKLGAARAAARPAPKEADSLQAAKDSLAKREKTDGDANTQVVARMATLRSGGTIAVAPAAAAGSAAVAPKLTGMLGQVKPGNAVILFGSDFGAAEGEVRMYGTFPNGFIKLSVDSWSNKAIGAFIPQVSGVLDQEITLKIVTKTAKASNSRTAPFTATREVRKVKMSEFETLQCRDAAFSVDKCVTVGETACSSSVCGSHTVPVFGTLAKSTDRFALHLKNGWTYESHSFDGEAVFSPPPYEWINPVVLLEMYLMGNDEPTLKVVSTGSAPSFEMPWAVPSLWADNYKFSLYVVGPAGTPFI